MSLRKHVTLVAATLLLGGSFAGPAVAAPARAATAGPSANRCAQKVTWKNTHGGLYLDAKGAGGKHTPVITWYGNGRSNQKWCMERMSGTRFNEWYFHPSYNTHLCMDVPGSRYYTGAKIVLWTCNGRRNQRFEITHVSKGSFFSPIDGMHNLRAHGAGKSVALNPAGNGLQTIWR